jgi:hypothetical protein
MRGLALILLLALLLGATVQAQPPRTSFTGDYYLEAAVSKVQPFVNEPVIYTMRYYAASPTNYALREPSYAGFYVAGQLTTTSAEIINGRQFLVFSMQTVLIPLNIGPMSIDAARVTVPATVFSDAVELSSETVRVDVLPPPDPTPDGYDGAVGRFDAAWLVSAATATIGTPVTLRYRISGSGGLPVIARPEIVVPEFWRAYPLPSQETLQFSGERLIGERIFEWLLIPDRAGSASIETAEFAFFDPEVMRYEQVALSPLRVEVIPAAGGRLETGRFDRSRLNQRLALVAVTGDVSRAGDDSPAAVMLLWVLPPLVFVGVWGGQRARQAIRTQQTRRRRQKAFKVALRALDRAAAHTGEEAFAAIERALTGYAADRLGVDAIRTDHLAAETAAGGLDPALAHKLEAIALQAREMRYAPAGMPVDSAGIIRAAAAILREADQSWPR